MEKTYKIYNIYKKIQKYLDFEKLNIFYKNS